MTKIEIDNKKMWESILGFQLEGEEAKKFNALCKYEPFKVTLAFFSKAFKNALKEQGLCYKEGEITAIEPDVKWYVALNDYGHYDNTIIGAVPLFLKGERTTKENVFNMCKDIMGYEITDEEFNKNFRPATEEETTRKTLVEVYQASVDSATKEPEQPKKRKVSSVLKNMLDNINEESLAKTREEMQKTPEIAEFDKAIETLIGNIDGDYCVYISSYDDYINKFAPKILAAARKLIASKLESMVDTMVSQNGGMCVHYREGVEDVINKIKGESV